MARVAVPPADLARLAAGAVAGAYGLGALAVARGPGETTTYAGESEFAAALAVLAGLALVAAGVATSLARQGRPDSAPRAWRMAGAIVATTAGPWSTPRR